MFTYLLRIFLSLRNHIVSVDVKHHVYLVTFPSLRNHIVSVDVEHHVYLVTFPSLRNNMVSVDVEHHVYLFTTHFFPSLIDHNNYGFCGH